MMNRRPIAFLATLLVLPALPVFAQTTIGGGTCSSATLSGTYEILLSGRQLTSAGVVTQVFQSVGTANFNGLSKVTIALTINTVTTSQAFGTQVMWSGSYSLQSNCVGAVSITTGDTATFTLEAYNQAPHTATAAGFALIGSDASYAFNGTGNNQPATCPTNITGAHEFNATGSGLSGATVTSTLDVAGILQFDGAGNITANWTQVSNLTTTQVTATGSYNVEAGCLASAIVTDAANNKYTFQMSFDTASPAFALTAASAGLVFDGSASALQAAAVTSCGTSQLNGTYYLALNGRVAPAGVATKILESAGSVTFDGTGNVTFNVTANAIDGSQAFGAPLTYSGTYSLGSSCMGSINITTGDTATFAIVAYNFNTTTLQAKSFQMVGTDATYAYTGGGTVQPAACVLASLSGEWPFSGTGNSLSGATNTGLSDLAGVLEFDGQGNVTATWTQVSNAASTPVQSSGTYSLNQACVGTINLTDSANNVYTGAISAYGVDTYGYSNDFDMTLASPQLIFTGTGRAAFSNPGESVVNNSDYGPGATPAGSVFAVFGTNLATKASQPTMIPLPTMVLTTQLFVNGEKTPMFYVSGGQLTAEVPEDIQPGLATVYVQNGSSTSNAVAVLIPTAAPEISVYGPNENQAVATYTNYGYVTVSNAAKIGDTVVLWFTGGGPVNASGKLATGAESPAGLSPVTGAYTITVGGVEATDIVYVGLTPDGIGLYQANFVVPTGTPSGNQKVQLTISGQASNQPLLPIK